MTSFKQFFSPHYTAQDVTFKSSQEVFKGHYKLLCHQLQYRLFSGEMGETLQRECFTTTPSVGVLLYDPKEDKIVLVQQFRIGALQDANSPWLVELIAGVIDTPDTPENIAKKETLEEAAIHIEQLHSFMRYWVSPGCSNEFMELFCGLIDSRHLPDSQIQGSKAEHEDIRVLVCTRSSAYEALKKGLISSASAIIALQWLELNYQHLQKNPKKVFEKYT